MKKRTMRLGCILLSTVLLGTAALTGCGQTKKKTFGVIQILGMNNRKAAVRKKVPKKKKVRRLTDSLMNPRWIWNMPKVFRYITTKTAIR